MTERPRPGRPSCSPGFRLPTPVNDEVACGCEVREMPSDFAGWRENALIYTQTLGEPQDKPFSGRERRGCRATRIRWRRAGEADSGLVVGRSRPPRPSIAAGLPQAGCWIVPARSEGAADGRSSAALQMIAVGT